MLQYRISEARSYCEDTTDDGDNLFYHLKFSPIIEDCPAWLNHLLNQRKSKSRKRIINDKEHKAGLSIVSQLVRYVPRTRMRPSRLTTICAYALRLKFVDFWLFYPRSGLAQCSNYFSYHGNYGCKGMPIPKVFYSRFKRE